jgi:sulfite exporter TauE/SafE
MLSSIHPLGERARHNRWALTVIAFTIGAVVSGSLVGLSLGAIGSIVLSPLRSSGLLVITAGAALIAGFLDISGVKPPGPSRQVNETWIGAFRGWVYGGGFGLELGLGFLTYVVTWGVYAAYLAALGTASPTLGAVVGGVFGLGRSLSLWLAGYVDRPSRLTGFNRRLATAGPIVRRATAVAFAVLGFGLIAGGVL